MKTFFKIVAIAALLSGVLSVAPSPAFAHPSLCLGIGEARTPNLGYSADPNSPGVRPAAVGGFTLTIGAGAGVGGCLSPSPLSPLVASGTLTGHCNLSVGSGTLLDGEAGHAFQVVGASLWLVIGTNTAGILLLTPLPGSGGGENSCLVGNANTYQVIGAVLNA